MEKGAWRNIGSGPTLPFGGCVMAGEVSLAQFKVLLGEFNEAIEVIARQTAVVHETLADIKQDFRHVTDLWSSPASLTFEPVRTEYERSSDDMDDVLAGILHRMRITYQNYVDMERKAVQNLSAHQQGDHGGGSGGGSGGGDNHSLLRTANTPAVGAKVTTMTDRMASALQPREPATLPTGAEPLHHEVAKLRSGAEEPLQPLERAVLPTAPKQGGS